MQHPEGVHRRSIILDTQSGNNTISKHYETKSIEDQGIQYDEYDGRVFVSIGAPLAQHVQAQQRGQQHNDEQGTVVQDQHVQQTFHHIRITAILRHKLNPAPVPRETIIIVQKGNPIESKRKKKA